MTSCPWPIVLALMVLASAGCSRVAARGELGVAIPPGDAVADQTRAWAPFLADMQKAVGVRVTPFYGSTDTALVDAMRFRQTDVGLFNNAAALQAVRRADGEVFARAARPDGSDVYRSVIIVRRGSGLTLDRLLACDRRVSFGLDEAGAAAGTQAPVTYLFAPRGVDPQGCFKSVRTAPVEANLYAVAAGVLDAAASDTATMTRAVLSDPAGGRRTLASVETVWSSPAIPDGPVVWRRDLDPGVKARLARFLFSYGAGPGREAERQRKVLRGLDLKGFVRADGSHLFPAREMRATDLLLKARARRDEAGMAAAQAELDAVAAARDRRG
ncbi:phosphate/phosphite/phosphonate ABC transporter substrate-binding protein [Phenylobacterium sp.]|uniref:phosphate/phosphite/phosphonate ABC transporter substrate-binding protein n=1 Tax=Phenylobacterium sp. TaxID=1871053 RepID=UPI002F3FF19C